MVLARGEGQQHKVRNAHTCIHNTHAHTHVLLKKLDEFHACLGRALCPVLHFSHITNEFLSIYFPIGIGYCRRRRYRARIGCCRWRDRARTFVECLTDKICLNNLNLNFTILQISNRLFAKQTANANLNFTHNFIHGQSILLKQTANAGAGNNRGAVVRGSLLNA